MGTTVSTIVISYDIDTQHSQVKDKMKELGYSESFSFKGQTKDYYLPNTTLWHSNKSSDAAINDLKSVCKSLNVNLEKALAVLAKEFVAI